MIGLYALNGLDVVCVICNVCDTKLAKLCADGFGGGKIFLRFSMNIFVQILDGSSKLKSMFSVYKIIVERFFLKIKISSTRNPSQLSINSDDSTPEFSQTTEIQKNFAVEKFRKLFQHALIKLTYPITPISILAIS